jgi:hypothetical protein
MYNSIDLWLQQLKLPVVHAIVERVDMAVCFSIWTAHPGMPGNASINRHPSNQGAVQT